MGWKAVDDTPLADDIQSGCKQSIAADNWIRGLQPHFVIPANKNEHHMVSALLEVADPSRDSLVFKLQAIKKGW